MIHAISAYGRNGASSRVRLHDWFSHLGLTPTVHDYAGFQDNRPKRVLKHPARVIEAELRIRALRTTGSTVVLSREATPFSWGDVEVRLLRDAALGVFDFDDAIFVDSGGARHWAQPARKCERAVRAADVVIAGNDYLAEWAAPFTGDLRVIPSCIEPDSYQAKTTWDTTERPRIVWLGSRSTEGYVAQIIRPLVEVCRRMDAQLVLISGPGDNPALADLGDSLTRVPWSLESVAAELAAADVAIAPLNDSAYARGKCAYKLLQYAATALPMIGSPIGANVEALSRFDGIAATTEDDWVAGLEQLLSESPSRRSARGLTALSAVARHYSFGAWATQWSDATGGVAKAADSTA